MKFLFYNLLVIIFLGVSSLGFSSSVCILVTQHDDKVSVLKETTYLIESGIMDTLYDAGYIVSDIPTNINGENTSALKIAIESGKSGYLAYVIHIIIYYQTTMPDDPARVILEEIQGIDWEIVRIHDASFIYGEKNIVPMKNVGEGDVYAIERLAKQLGADIQNALSGNI